jgi:hypothetical protein
MKQGNNDNNTVFRVRYGSFVTGRVQYTDWQGVNFNVKLLTRCPSVYQLT